MADVEVIIDNTGLALSQMEAGIERALEVIGGECEKDAKMVCPVDTGLLRNSITHVTGGGAISGMFHGDNKSRYSKANAVPIRFVNISVPADSGSSKSVYIGTAVEYGIYVHEGHGLPNGKSVAPRRFLKNALMNNAQKYKQMAEVALKGFLQ